MVEIIMKKIVISCLFLLTGLCQCADVKVPKQDFTIPKKWGVVHVGSDLDGAVAFYFGGLALSWQAIKSDVKVVPQRFLRSGNRIAAGMAAVALLAGVRCSHERERMRKEKELLTR